MGPDYENFVLKDRLRAIRSLLSHYPLSEELATIIVGMTDVVPPDNSIAAVHIDSTKYDGMQTYQMMSGIIQTAILQKMVIRLEVYPKNPKRFWQSFFQGFYSNFNVDYHPYIIIESNFDPSEMADLIRSSNHDSAFQKAIEDILDI